MAGLFGGAVTLFSALDLSVLEMSLHCEDMPEMPASGLAFADFLLGGGKIGEVFEGLKSGDTCHISTPVSWKKYPK